MNGSHRRDTVLPPGRAVTGSASSKSAPPLLAYLIQYHFFQRPRLKLFGSSTLTDLAPAALRLSSLVRGRPSATTYLSIFFLPNASLLSAKTERNQGLELTLTAKLCS